MSFFISIAEAAEPAAQAPGGGFGSLLIFVPLIVLMYFLMIRPQQKRIKEHQALLGSLSKGDEIATSGGILGKITALDDNFVTLKIAQNVEIKVQKSSVGAVLPKGTIKGTS